MLTSPPSHQVNLDQVAHQLSQRLQAQQPMVANWRIRLSTRQGALLVLEEHAATEEPEAADALAATAEILRSLLDQIARTETSLAAHLPADDIPIRLYLRRLGETRPYLTRSLVWRRSDFSAAALAEAVALGEETSTSSDLTAHTALVPFYASELSPDAVADVADQQLPQGRRWPMPFPLPPGWLVGTVAGAMLLLGFGYSVTRPCVVGRCDRVLTAAVLSEEALDSLKVQPSPADVLQAHTKLESAVAILQPIPPWSRHHTAAQAASEVYQQEADVLAQVIAAQKSATLAAEKSQNPPHAVVHWQVVEEYWRQAIAQLEQVPTDNLVYAFAQKKRQEYEANLVKTSDRVAAEQAAAAALEQAIESAQLGLHHMETAEALPSWQVAHREWQTAMNQLRRIPQGTMAYADAQDLLTTYRNNFMETRDRLNREQLGNRAYTQATQAAQRAQQLERQNQWTLAVQNWRQALEYAQQVPSDTSFSANAQTLLDPYRLSLTQAQQKLAGVVGVQKIQQQLDQICGPTSRICRYRRLGDRVRIHVIALYANVIEQTFSDPRLAGSPQMTPEVARNTTQLLQQVAELSRTAQSEIEIYDSKGAFIVRYRPDLGGFVKH
ncbi:hypothetical protein [Almyronema epifaneia]|uniref:Uncharacterized protein n=1 Tax=Almyronema epifaneia S1 TaxID=2991925 RepID=A0ABW6IBY9_9CYAN